MSFTYFEKKTKNTVTTEFHSVLHSNENLVAVDGHIDEVYAKSNFKTYRHEWCRNAVFASL